MDLAGPCLVMPRQKEISTRERAPAVKPLPVLAGTCALLIGMATWAGPAIAQSLEDSKTIDAQQAPPSTGVTGDLGTHLSDEGVNSTASYISETAWNFKGGTRQLVRETGQFTLGFTGDMDRLLGLQGGTVQFTVTDRRGDDLGAAAGLGVLQQVQEVYGRGQTARLTQFWYEQTFAQGAVALKLGRATVSEDFDSFSCYFMNLSFCGSQPGNIAGSYWYDSPISQWTGRLRYNQDDGYIQGAVYEINPHNLDNSFSFGKFDGATGVLVPVEIGLNSDTTATDGISFYKLGAWYSDAPGEDVFLNTDYQPRVVAGGDPLLRRSRYGLWVSGQQQIFGTAADGKIVSGLAAFFNVTFTDHRTSTIDDQIATGLWWKGIIPSLPDDVLGIGVVRTHVNALVASSEGLDPAGSLIQHSEYAAEVYYSLHPFDWLEMRPDFQLIRDPGGFRNAPDVGVAGLKAAVTL
jgi:porin